MRAILRSAVIGFTLLLAMVVVNATPAQAGYKEDFVKLLNAYYGSICTAKLEGWSSKTLRIDWTAETVVLHMAKIYAEIGDSKIELYKDGVRYLKFPNDEGGYNIIDWKTGEKRSVNERAPYYFQGGD